MKDENPDAKLQIFVNTEYPDIDDAEKEATNWRDTYLDALKKPYSSEYINFCHLGFSIAKKRLERMLENEMRWQQAQQWMSDLLQQELDQTDDLDRLSDRKEERQFIEEAFSGEVRGFSPEKLVDFYRFKK